MTSRGKKEEELGTSSVKKPAPKTKASKNKKPVPPKKKQSKPAVKKKPVARKKLPKKKPLSAVLKIPKPVNIYDMHPFRKLIELWVYNIYAGRERKYFESMEDKDKGSVFVSQKDLKKIVGTKAKRLQLRQHISSEISIDFHPDQKALLWDYLEHGDLPRSINLTVNYFDPLLWNVIATPQQRKMIEGYFLLGRTPAEITTMLNRVSMFVPVTIDVVESYLYFMWNLDTEDRTTIYPIQLLASNILNVRNNISGEFYYNNIYNAQNKENPLTLDDVRRTFVKDFVKCIIKTPYLSSDTVETYISWFLIAPKDPGRSEEIMVPMDSYDVPLKISTYTATIEDLELGIRVVSGDKLTVRSRMERISEKLMVRAEALVNKGDYQEFAAFMRSSILPTAQVSQLWGILIDVGGGGNIVDGQPTEDGDPEEYKESLEIEVHQDRDTRREKLLGTGEKGDEPVVSVPFPSED